VCELGSDLNRVMSDCRLTGVPARHPLEGLILIQLNDLSVAVVAS
jgi:hypothetical protein